MIRKFNALSILHKNKNPKYSRKAREDMRYVQSLKRKAGK